MPNTRKIIENIINIIKKLFFSPFTSTQKTDATKPLQIPSGKRPSKSLIYRIINGFWSEVIFSVNNFLLLTLPHYLTAAAEHNFSTTEEKGTEMSVDKNPAMLFVHGLRGHPSNFWLIIQSIRANYSKEVLTIYTAEISAEQKLTKDAKILAEKIKILSKNHKTIYIVGHSRGSRVARKAYELLKEKGDNSAEKIHTVHLISSPEGAIEIVELADYCLKLFGKNYYSGYLLRLALRVLIEDFFQIKESYCQFTKYPDHIKLLSFKQEIQTKNNQDQLSKKHPIREQIFKVIASSYDTIVGCIRNQQPEDFSKTMCIASGHMSVLHHPKTIDHFLHETKMFIQAATDAPLPKVKLLNEITGKQRSTEIDDNEYSIYDEEGPSPRTIVEIS